MGAEAGEVLERQRLDADLIHPATRLPQPTEKDGTMIYECHGVNLNTALVEYGHAVEADY